MFHVPENKYLRLSYSYDIPLSHALHESLSTLSTLMSESHPPSVLHKKVESREGKKINLSWTTNSFRNAYVSRKRVRSVAHFVGKYEVESGHRRDVVQRDDNLPRGVTRQQKKCKRVVSKTTSAESSASEANDDGKIKLFVCCASMFGDSETD